MARAGQVYMNILVFSDLDGTLLDHGDYSFEAAKPALKKIREHQIPLILTSSKTRHEIELLQRAMGIHDPFIAENGAAIFFPYRYRNYKIDAGTHHGHYTVIQLGTGYGMIRCFFAELKKRSYINPRAKAADRAPDFSQRIREGLPVPGRTQ